MSQPSLSPEQLVAFVRGMPKAELHMHIEGSLEPELMFALAQRNGIELPYASVDALRAAYNFSDLQSFLDIYYAGASVLQTEADFYDMAWAYFLRAKADNVVHAELFFDPQTHTARGVSIATVINGLYRASQQAQAELGIRAQWILCFLRHLSEADAIATLQSGLPHIDKFIGVGLDSSERGHPPETFRKAFELARMLGLRRVAHAGEEGPPEYIWAALDVLGAERIDHGVRAIDDTVLMERLARERIALTVCPLSNLKLCVFPTLRDHNLGKMLDAGVAVTINSDDPAYFGGYINDNFNALVDAVDLSREEIIELVNNSFTSSFLDQDAKNRHLAAVRRVAAA